MIVASYRGVPELLQERQAVHAGHVDVAQHHVEIAVAGDDGQRLHAVACEQKSRTSSRIWRRNFWTTSASRSGSSSTTKMRAGRPLLLFRDQEQTIRRRGQEVDHFVRSDVRSREPSWSSIGVDILLLAAELAYARPDGPRGDDHVSKLAISTQVRFQRRRGTLAAGSGCRNVR